MMKKRITCLILALLLFCSTWTDAFVVARAEENYTVSGEADSQEDEQKIAEEVPSERNGTEAQEAGEKKNDETETAGGESTDSSADQSIGEGQSSTDGAQTGNGDEQEVSKDETAGDGTSADENTGVGSDGDVNGDNKADPVKESDNAAENSVGDFEYLESGSNDRNTQDTESNVVVDDKHDFTYTYVADGIHNIYCKNEGCEFVASEKCSPVYSEADNGFVCGKCGHAMEGVQELLAEEGLVIESEETIDYNEVSFDALAPGTTGDKVVEYATTHFNGWRYPGREERTDASKKIADCSGFVHLVYEYFGLKNLPWGCDDYAGGRAETYGTVVTNKFQLQKGDIVLYGKKTDEYKYATLSHAAIYIGEGKIINSIPDGGVRILYLDGALGTGHSDYGKGGGKIPGFWDPDGNVFQFAVRVIGGEPSDPRTITASEPTNITSTQAHVKATINLKSFASEIGVYLGKAGEELEKHIQKTANSTKEIGITLGNGTTTPALAPNTTYNYKIYAKIFGIEIKSALKSFTTKVGNLGSSGNATSSKVSISMSKYPSGQRSIGDYCSVAGEVRSNLNLKSVTAMVRKKDGSSVKEVKDVTVNNIGKTTYKFAEFSKIDNGMTFSKMNTPGDYYFKIVATDIKGTQSEFKSDFKLVAKANKTNIVTPTMALGTSRNTLDETSAIRTAVITNPSRLKISSVGMILYDYNGNVIARCEEPQNNYYSTLTIWYATDKKTDTNLNCRLIPGTRYFYRFFATVGGKYYDVTGDFTTKGSSKPKTPLLRCSQTDVAEGDIIKVEWDAVEYAREYEVSLWNAYGDETSFVVTSLTSASFTAPQAGDYTVKIIAKGYQNSDTGTLASKIRVHGYSVVNFVMEDGNDIINLGDPQAVKYRGNAVAPYAPSKEGWVFQGWDGSYQNVTSDTTVKAVFTRCKYQVTFKANIKGTPQTITQVVTEYEGSVEPPEAPEPEPGYIFVGWDTEDYKYVTKNMTVSAVYVYANDNLPIQLELNKCEFDPDGSGYTLTYSIQNYDKKATTGRAVASLLTSEGRLVYTTESNAFSIGKNAKKENIEVFVPYKGEAATAQIVIISEFSNSIPISEKKSTDDIKRTWSAWSTEEPQGSVAEIETRTLYRYRDKQFKTDSSPTVAGWEYVDSEQYWGEWSAWKNDWSRTRQATSDYKQEQTRTVVDRAAYNEQNYYFYRYVKTNGNIMYSYADRSGRSDVKECFRRDIWIGPGDSRTMTYRGLDDGHEQYTCNPYQYYKVEYWYKGSIRTIPAVTHQEYRYSTRSLLTRYKFQRWGDWSDYSTTEYTGTSTRQVESIVEYRYKRDAAANDQWDGDKYTIDGKVDENLAGSQALLVVYKHEDPADFNNEYLGQTVIEEDGSYSFEFYTREKPTWVTGDFTIKLGIEGAKELLYVDKIDAPKREYLVRFVDWDGTPISDQAVLEGGTAIEPESPYRDGYRFMGWDTGLTNVHDDLDITARYERLQCTVVFADWGNQTVETQQYYIGDTIVPPVYRDIEGYTFLGWLDEYGQEVTVAYDNLVLSAEYDAEEYKVTFYDADNNELYYDIVAYGESVVPPSAPDIEGKRFVGWSSYDYSSVKGDLDIYPIYEYEETAATPTADIKSQTFDKVTKVSLSCSDADAIILYTTDGSTPDMFSNEYKEPITIDKNTVLQFYARANNKNDSEIVSEAYLYTKGEDTSGALAIKNNKLNLLLEEEAPQITYFLHHDKDPNVGVNFYTLDDHVVSVDEEGRLTPNNIGSTQVFAITKDGRYADYCDVTVTSNEIAITSMDLSEDNVSLFVGEEIDLTTEIVPYNATYQSVMWSSGDDEVVSVNDEGHIIAQAPGSAYISAYSYAGRNVAYCHVNVEDTSVTLSDQEIVIAVGQQHQLIARTYSGAVVSWKTDRTDIATVTENGLVTGVSGGTAIIVVMAENGDFRTCTVRVTTGPDVALPPAAPKVVAVTDTTIEIEEQEGCEYSLDGINWQTETIFDSLKPNTQYYIFARVKATVTMLASPASVGTLVMTEKADAGEAGQDTPTAPDMPTVPDTQITVSEIPDQIYTGTGITPKIEVHRGSGVLIEERDYTVSYTDNIDASDSLPTAVISGKGIFEGTITKTFRILPKDINANDIFIKDIILAYNGETQKPIPEITDADRMLANGKDFLVEYPDSMQGAYAANGDYNITIKGTGNYIGARQIGMTITDKELISNASIKVPKAKKYSGEKQVTSLSVSLKGQVLRENEDYVIEYPSTKAGAYIYAGQWPVAVRGIGSYAGVRYCYMNISALPIKKAVITGIKNINWSGNVAEQSDINVMLGGNVLRPNEDYILVYHKNYKAGKAKIEAKGINGYKGSVKKAFKIKPYDIQKNEAGSLQIAGLYDAANYVKGGSEFDLSIYCDGNLLVENKDYTVKYKNNKKLYDGSNSKKVPSVTIKGKGSYKGTIKHTFTIHRQKISALEIEVNDVLYSKQEGYYRIKPTIKDMNGEKLVAGEDYEAELKYLYMDETPVGYNEMPEPGSGLAVMITGKGCYEGVGKAYYRIVEKSIEDSKVDQTACPYNGSKVVLQTGQLQIHYGDELLVEGKDFEILENTYKNNNGPGTATVYIKGLGDFGGIKKVTFKIDRIKL